MKLLLHSYVEQGLNATPAAGHRQRSAASLPRLEGALAIKDEPLSNAVLYDLLDA